MFDFIQFLRPLWLLLLPIICYLWWLEQYRTADSSIWNSVCDNKILRVLLQSGKQQQAVMQSHHLIAMLSILAVIALAGPSWQKQSSSLLRSNAALFIAFDLSNSMLVHDVNPSRYVRARFKIEDLLNQHRKGDVALIAYAADAYAVTPLTHDVENIKTLVPSLSPKIMPGRGSNIQAALSLAKELLDRSNLKKGDILFVTDGIGNANLNKLIRFANESKLRISVLGIGTEQGGSIPALNEIDVLRKEDGTLIESKYESESLKKLSNSTNGLYMESGIDNNDVNELSVFLNRPDNQHRESDEVGEFERLDNGIWIVLFSLLFAVFVFRKNLLFIFVVAIFHYQPEQLQAAELNNWFQNDNQKAKQAFDENDYRHSLQLFNDKRWRAASAYRLGDWQQAYDLYIQLDDTQSIYNRGNSLVFLARLEEAVIAYNEVLKREPEHVDAKHNKEEILELLKKLSKGKQSDKRSLDDDNQNKEQQAKSDDKENQEVGESDNKPPSASDEQADSQQNAVGEDEVPVENSMNKPSDSNDANSAELSEIEREIQEDTLAEDQWMRRIKDDPAGLMRRKFKEKYKEKSADRNYTGDPW